VTTLHEPADAVDDLAQAVGRAAHDLNNLCASVLGFTALTQESLPPDSPLQSYLAEVQAATEKTSALAERLRAMSHAARTKPRPVFGTGQGKVD
jgi:signal transduction histidine kinase